MYTSANLGYSKGIFSYMITVSFFPKVYLFKTFYGLLKESFVNQLAVSQIHHYTSMFELHQRHEDGILPIKMLISKILNSTKVQQRNILSSKLF